MKLKLLLFSCITFLIFPFYSLPVLAGGGRVTFTYNRNGVAGQQQANLVALVFHAGSANQAISTNEKFEFRIENPRPGDSCSGKTDRTNEQGLIEGFCSATQPGNFLVYLYSLDNNDESSRIYVYFDPPPTPIPTSIPIPTSTQPPTPTEEVTPSLQVSTPTQTPENITPTTIPTQVKSNTNRVISGSLLAIVFLILLSAFFMKKRYNNSKPSQSMIQKDDNQVNNTSNPDKKNGISSKKKWDNRKE